MTDAAEVKYGFEPQDASSFPTEPEVIAPAQFPIDDSEIGAYYEVSIDVIDILWANPQDGSYSLSLKTSGSDEWNIYYGGHYTEHAPVDLKQFALTGTEMLTGSFTKYALDNSFVEQHGEFTLDLSTIEFPNASQVGIDTNKINYTFSDDFPQEAEDEYREFLKRVFPIMYEHLGPPAETFNVFIKNMGEETGYFIVVDDGRTFLTDTDFIPRLIVHELIHAWKGRYLVTSNASWDYDDALSGFEEATAEGTAFEIIHEYVRSYPNDPATIKLLESKPYQYWSAGTTSYDSIKNNRRTGAGDFWPGDSGELIRYFIASTTLQMIVRENPTFIRDFMSVYFATIRGNPDWRPNRNDIIDMWETLVPALNGYPLRSYLDTLPVFNGRKLDEGIYVLTTIRPYGTIGDQQFAVGYALSGDYCFDQDGKVWWGLCDQSELDTIPTWLRTSLGDDSFYYTDMQNSKFMVDVVDASGNDYATYDYHTVWDRHPDGSPTGLGWYWAEELEMEKLPLGLYKETVTFTDFIQYDQGARETFYFFGLKDFQQDRETEYVIMIGVDGVPEGTAHIEILGQGYTSPINNGVAVFRSQEWPFDMQGRFPITITNPESVSRDYYRTIVESGTIHNYFQQQYIIVDTNFNGIEDQFE